MPIAQDALRMSGFFEAEVLVELTLRYWHHPLAGDEEFRSTLLERAAEALRQAVAGIALFDDLDAANTNLIAAIWYAEWTELDTLTRSVDTEANIPGRRQWLDDVRRALPSCFCDPEQLP